MSNVETRPLYALFKYLLKINKYQFLGRCKIKNERRGKDKRPAY